MYVPGQIQLASKPLKISFNQIRNKHMYFGSTNTHKKKSTAILKRKSNISFYFFYKNGFNNFDNLCQKQCLYDFGIHTTHYYYYFFFLIPQKHFLYKLLAVASKPLSLLWRNSHQTRNYSQLKCLRNYFETSLK